MDISITLLIEKALPIQSGVSAKSGNAWTRQEFIGKTIDQYPKTVVFNLFGDAINQNPIMEGHTYNVHLDIESRPYTDKSGNERWSTSVSAWKAELAIEDGATNTDANTATTSQFTAPKAQPQETSYAQPQLNVEPTDSLPF